LSEEKKAKDERKVGDRRNSYGRDGGRRKEGVRKPELRRKVAEVKRWREEGRAGRVESAESEVMKTTLFSRKTRQRWQ
jgi:hypothetical protein